MELLLLGEDVLHLHVLPFASYVTVARLSCTCSVMRAIGRRISKQPFVRTCMEGRKDVQPFPSLPLPIPSLTIAELKFILKRHSINTSALEDEAGSDENLRAALVDRLELAINDSAGSDELSHALAEVSRARALLDRLSMPARPDLCLVFVSSCLMGVAEVLAELLPPTCVVFGAIANRGIIGMTAERTVSEVDSDSEPLISVTLVHLTGTQLHPFYQPCMDPHSHKATPCAEVALALSRAREHSSRQPQQLRSPPHSTLLLLADGSDSVMRGAGLMEQMRGHGIPLLGGLVEKDAGGTLLLRAPTRPHLRDGLRRCNGAVGLLLEGAHSVVPAVTRGAALICDDEWTVSDAESNSRAVCPGHRVSQHIVKKLEHRSAGGEGGLAAARSTTPLQALYELATRNGGSLPSPLYLALRTDPLEARRRLVHPVHVLHHTGAVEVESAVEIGELCSFASVHAQGSSDELGLCARAAQGRLASDGPMLCLSFVCCGRGVRFHTAADKETLPIRSQFPDAAFAGFFAAGELGPRPFSEVGSDREDEPALMGFTAVHALLRFHEG